MARQERGGHPHRADPAAVAAQRGRQSRRHRQERRPAHVDVRAARLRGVALGHERLADRVRAARGGQRARLGDLLFPLRRPGLRPEGVDARRAVQSRRLCRRPTGDDRAAVSGRQSRHPHLRAIGIRRQGTDRGIAGRDGRPDCHQGQHPVEHPRGPRRRGGGRLAQLQRHDAAARGGSEERSRGDRGQPAPSQWITHGVLRQPRRGQRHHQGPWRDRRPAQRQLRELRHRSGDGAREADRDAERRPEQCRHQRASTTM